MSRLTMLYDIGSNFMDRVLRSPLQRNHKIEPKTNLPFT